MVYQLIQPSRLLVVSHQGEDELEQYLHGAGFDVTTVPLSDAHHACSGNYNLVLVVVGSAADLSATDAASACHLPVIVLLDQYDTILMQAAIQYRVSDCLVRSQLDTFTLRRIAHHMGNGLQVVRQMLDHTVDGMIIVSEDGRILFANQTAAEMFNRRYHELESESLGIPVVLGESSEIDILHSKEELRTVEMRVGTINWMGEAAYLASLRDITPHKRLQQALQEAEAFGRAILNSLQTTIAVVDEHGTIVNVNNSWIRFARENGDPDLKATGIGVNYFDVIRKSNEHDYSRGSKVLAGMMSVLNGETHSFEMKYPCHSPTEDRWFMMRVTPLEGEGRRGLVISHIDITVQHIATRLEAHQFWDDERQQQRGRDMEAFTAFADTIRLNSENEIFETLVQRYGKLLDLALEERAFKVNHDISGEARAIAEFMGRQTAGPRDVIRMHLRTMSVKQRKATTPVKEKAYLDEGRLLVLEIMGYLTSFYRDMILADIELHNT